MTKISTRRLNNRWHFFMGAMMAFAAACFLLMAIDILSAIVMLVCMVLSSLYLLWITARWESLTAGQL